MQDPSITDTDLDAVGTVSDSVEVHTATPAKLGEGKVHGLKIARKYTEAGEDVWSTVEWEKRSAVITGLRV